MFRPGQLRFLLAVLVVFCHLSQSIFLGKFAVGCFFILSGYWISLMYEKKYSKIKSSLKVFYISRIWRLLPVFLTCTIIGLLVHIIADADFFSKFNTYTKSEDSNVIISNLLILGYSMSKFKILVPAWSLDIEMQFYLVFPLLIFIVKDKIILLIPFISVVFLLSFGIMFSKNIYFSNTLLNYLYLFCVGTIIYYYRINSSRNIENWSLGLLVVVMIIQYFIPSLAVYYRDSSSKYYSILSLILTMAAIPSLINSIHNNTSERDKFWGEMSYITYLTHWVWLIPYNLLILNGNKLSRIPYAVGFLSLTYLSSYLIYKFIDRPMEKFRHAWIKKQERVSSSIAD